MQTKNSFTKTYAMAALGMLLLGCFALSPNAQGLLPPPPPDGSYPGNNTAEGTQALFSLTTGINNTAIGVQALFSDTSGNYNTGVGIHALFSNTGGSYNTAFGSSVLNSNTNGLYNLGSGFQALYSNTTGSNNTGNGTQALFRNTTGVFNTATGSGSLASNTMANANTADGFQTLFRTTTGSNNTANGHQALYNNTTGHSNTADGFRALYGNTIGVNNIALGREAGKNLTTGNNNIDIGSVGLAGESGIIRIGTLGTHTDTFLTSNFHVATSELFIGESRIGHFDGAFNFTFDPGAPSEPGFVIEQSLGSESAGIHMDGNSITMWSPGDNNRLLRILDEDGMIERCYVDGSGNVVANGVMLTSSRRFKQNVTPIANALGKVSRLQGVTFDWVKDHGGKSDIGFVAEDVAKVLPELVLWEANGKDAVGLEYANMTAVAVEAIKELKAQKDEEIAALKAANAALEKKMASYNEKLAALEARDQAREARLTRLELNKAAPQLVARKQ
jgi:hypothetical protein